MSDFFLRMRKNDQSIFLICSKWLKIAYYFFLQKVSGRFGGIFPIYEISHQMALWKKIQLSSLPFEIYNERGYKRENGKSFWIYRTVPSGEECQNSFKTATSLFVKGIMELFSAILKLWANLFSACAIIFLVLVLFRPNHLW